MRIRLILLAVLWLASSLAAQSAQQVDESLKRAKAFLYARQAEGHWEQVPARDASAVDGNSTRGAQWGGTTALATYALLAAGEKPTDARLAPAIEFLKKANLIGTYAISMRCMVALNLPKTDEVKAMAKKDATSLLQTIKQERPARGFYDYTNTGRQPAYSLSRGQYGVMGVWAASQCGVDIPEDYWRLVEDAWTKAQFPNGAWNYGEAANFRPTPEMTAAGAATLYLVGDSLRAKDAPCRGNATNPVLDKALKYLAGNIDKFAARDRHARDFPYASLYSLERIGMASGLKYFKGVDWYQHGASWLLANQAADGSWDSTDPEFGPIIDTSFAMLFLARGRAPVAFTKLDYSEPKRPAQGGWNQRPRDVANLAAYVGRQLEREVAWQTLDLSAADRDFQDAPILYLSGSGAFDLSPQGTERLRRYIQQGGLVVGHADCASAPFAASFRKLAGELFPAYAWRDLPPGHLIYSILCKRDQWKTKVDVAGISNGVREMMILLPPAGDLARSWQIQSTGKEEHWQLPMNLLLYATDQGRLHVRGDSHLIEKDPKMVPNRAISLVRLQYEGNWDPEPAGWQRLTSHLHNAEGVELKVTSAKLDQKLPAGAIAHLTGTSAFELSPAARENLKAFLDGGGLLVVDAAGGSSEFATSAENEIRQITGQAPAALPAGHPIYTLKAHAIGEVAHRTFAQKTVGNLKTPRLMAVESNGRPIVIYSREDLSAGLVGQDVAGIRGYSPASALALMRNILLAH